MKLAKILFLDFDGVLHPVSRPGLDVRQFVWLPILKELIAGQDDLRIVIHASYRKTSPADFLREQLGFGKEICLGVTNPRLERWASIQDWVKGRPWIESFRVVDDQAWEFPEPLPPQLILCDGVRGVSDTAVQAALKEWLR
uniref:HAD domain-containing protein n=1 Tax=Hylemonella sp. TaxID=2066020 RepID=UPI0035B0FDB9